MLAATSLVGKCVGNYRLLRSIGRGSMGEVFEAEHVLVGRRAAVKVLLPGLSSFTEVTNRFFNEARAVASLRHEGLVQLFEFGVHEGGRAFLVMELLEGATVAQVVREDGPLKVPVAVDVARQVAGAMASAHASGVVHRDLKPENIVLLRDDDALPWRAKVLDFGIAKMASGSLMGANATRTGQILGTPAFMSPEQCHGASHVDDRADIYALGCVLYYMLTGRPPFVSDGVGATIAAHLYLRPVKPSTYVDGIPAGLESLILKLLSKAPEDRPSSMIQVEQLLAAVLAEAAEEEPYEIELSTDERISATAREIDAPPAGEIFEPARLATAGNSSLSLDGRPRVPRWRLAAAAAAVVLLATFVPVRWRTTEVGGAEPGAWETMRPIAAELGRFLPANADTTANATDATDATDATTATAWTSLLDPADDGGAPRTITVRVVSRPIGAEVWRASDGRRLGVTPLLLDVPLGQDAIRLRVRKPGFIAESVELPTDRDGQVAVVLSPRLRAAASAAVARRPKLAKPVKDGALDPFGD